MVVKNHRRAGVTFQQRLRRTRPAGW